MNTMIMWEFKFAGECFLLGIILMFVYDIFKLKRIIIRHSYWLIAAEDIVYWFMSGSLMFLLLYKEDAGNIRWFSIGFTLIGMCVYFLAVSRNIMPLIEIAWKRYSKKVRLVLQKLKKKDTMK